MQEIPPRLAQEIRTREQLGEVLIVVGERSATESGSTGIAYLHISAGIFRITGYQASELADVGLKPILPDSWQDKHELMMLRELRAIRERGPTSKIMGSSGGSVRTVSFTQKSGKVGSLVLPIYGYLLGGNPYLLGVINEVTAPPKQVDYPSGEIDCFQSYGRGDFANSNFPREIVHLLQELRINAWLDTNDIPLASADFMHIIRRAIAGASNVLFLAGPHSVCSPYCAEELRIAREMGKQILVVLIQRHGTVELNQASWNYLYPESADGYKSAVSESRNIQAIDTEGLLKQFQPSLSVSNWLIWDETQGFPAFLPRIEKFIRNDIELKRTQTKFLLRAIEWRENGKSAQFLLSQKEILEAQEWLINPGPNRVIPLLADYISNSCQIRSGNYADVFICSDLHGAVDLEELMYKLQLKGLSVWCDNNSLEESDLDEQSRQYKGIVRSANVVFIASRTSITNDSCQAQLAYAGEQNKPLYLVSITPGLASELPGYLQARPLLDLTDQNRQPAISRLSYEFLKDGLDHKKVMARLATQAQRNWNRKTKIPLNPEQLSTAIAYVKKGRFSDKYPPPPLVNQMLEFSLQEKKPFWFRALPWVAGGVALTGLGFGIISWLSPAPIPEDLAEIRSWDFPLRDIEQATGVDREHIFQCTKELKDALPLPGEPNLQPISAMYAFAYSYNDDAQVIGRTAVCQATGVDPTKGIPRWIFSVDMDNPGYQRQLAAHEGNPRLGQKARCFAAFDVTDENRSNVEALAADMLAQDVVVEGVRNAEEFSRTLLHRIMARSEFSLILSCPAQTLGSPIERKLGSYVSAAVISEHLRSVDPQVLVSIVRDRATGNRTALQLPPPVEIRRHAEDHSFRVALFIKAAAAVDGVDDPVQQAWVDEVERVATENNSVVDLYDLPCQKCHLDQIIDLQHLATDPNPPDGIIVAASNSLLISAALKDLYDQAFPIVAFDTEVTNDNLLAFVGPDNEGLAYDVARWGVEAAAEGKALIVNGPLVQKNARDREQGFLRALAENPLIENVGSGTGDWSEASGYNLGTNMLGAFPDARLFLVANDRMAIGVARAAADQGKRDQLVITGFDFLGPWVLDHIDATISQGSEEQAKTAAEVMFDYLRTGESPDDPTIILNHQEPQTREGQE